MVDAVQADEADDNKIDGDDVIQYPRSNGDQDSRDESDDREIWAAVRCMWTPAASE